MRTVTVFGANGKVGSIVVDLLLARGYEVIAFVHSAAHLNARDHCKVIQGDIHDLEAVESAIKGSDWVISTLGSWGTPRKDILRVGVEHIMAGMRKYGVVRIVSLTGAEARLKSDDKTVLHRAAHAAAKVIAGAILEDGEEHMRLLQQSDLRWTVIRSPIMNEKGEDTFSLSHTRPKPWATIHRHAVAEAMVNQLTDLSHNRSSPFINR